MKPPQISVILPFFNAEKTLERALLSIQNQSFTDFECLMIDNNSSDSSPQIANQFAQQDSRFKLLYEQQQGVVYASNKGSSAALGKYHCRMDADDESTINRLEDQFNFLEENSDYGAVSGKVEYIAHAKNTEGFANYVVWVNSLESYEQIYVKRFMESPIVNPSAMWRKEVATKYGMYQNGDFPEDYELWLRWLDAGVKIGKVSATVLQWYDSEKRLTRTHPSYSIDAFYRAKTPFLLRYLQQINVHFPKVYSWGASKIARKRAQILEPYGIVIEAYIDISEKRQIGKKLLHYKDLPPVGKAFILVYVKQTNMRQQVEEFLHTKNYQEGRDYLLIS
jgi:glycosyltransferase involved in cell wall biosynthesis